jgi:hypothetical protein
MAQTNAGRNGVRPVRVNFPEADHTELRRRIHAIGAMSVFPDELYEAPRSWAERAYPTSSITTGFTTGSTKAATLRRESSRNSYRKKFVRASDQSVNRLRICLRADPLSFARKRSKCETMGSPFRAYRSS